MVLNIRNLLAEVWFAYSRFIFGSPPLFNILAPEYFHVRAIFCFVRDSLKYVSRGQYILDVGCGDQRYKKYAAASNTYIAMDHGQSVGKIYYKGVRPGIIGDIKAIPLESSCIDYILCTEVLEHVNDTIQAMKEVSRVLREAGLLIITVPFIFPEHDYPNDYYRYTMGGIKFICEQAGLEIDEIVKIGGLGTVFVDLLARVFSNFLNSTILGKIFYYSVGLLAVPLIYLLLNIVGYFLNVIKLSSFYSGVGLVCKKNGYVWARQPYERDY